MKVILTYRTSENTTSSVDFTCKNVKFGKHPDDKKDTGMVEFDQIGPEKTPPVIKILDNDIKKGWLKDRMTVNKDLFGEWWMQIDGDAIVMMKAIDG